MCTQQIVSEIKESVRAIGQLDDKEVSQLQPNLSLAPVFNKSVFNQDVGSAIAQSNRESEISPYQNLPLDVLTSISKFLDIDVLKNVSQTLSGGSKWAFLRAHSQQYFLALYQELRAFKDISEIPDSLRRLLANCTYVDVSKLLELDYIQPDASFAELFSLFEHVKTLRAGKDVPRAFFENNLKSIIETSTTLRYLNASCSKITDEDLKACPEANLQKINLSKTSIDGSCLSGAVCAKVEALNLSCCENLKDEYLKECSSTALEEIDLSWTHINGSGLSGPAFKKVRALDVSYYTDITDEHLKNCSSEALEILILSHTKINGSSLSGNAFKIVKELDLCGCKELKDEYLIHFSSKALEFLDLAETSIEGSSLSGTAIESVKEMRLHQCRELKDKYLKHCSSEVLEFLDLSWTCIDGSSLSGDAFAMLKAVDLSCCTSLEDKHLKKCSSKALEILDLSHTLVSGNCLFADAFARLHQLEVKGCRNFKKEHLDNFSKGIDVRIILD